MRSAMSDTTQDSQPRRKGEACSKGTLAAYSEEWPARGPWPSETPPTAALTGVRGALAFYYRACWLHYRSAQCRGKTSW
jgi:hypothetical protein